jgi:SEC-C motif-containing protein
LNTAQRQGKMAGAVVLATISRMRKNLLAAHAPCPCGSDATYVNCCGPFHAAIRNAAPGGPFAPTPEALMRSRYSAYVLGLIDYLLATWHPSTAPGDLELSPVKWLGLEVRHAQSSGDAGVVEFVARYRSYDSAGGKAQRMHETSRFVRIEARWYYIDGQMSDTA